MHSIRTKISLATIGAIIFTMIIAAVFGVAAIKNIGQDSSEQILRLLCDAGQKNLNAGLQDVEQNVQTISAYVESDLDGLEDQKLQAHLDRRMAASDSLTDGPCFYPFPNESPDSHDRTKWGSRCTRLVVRATLGGRTTYYPVTFQRIERNHHYAVDLTISNYGVEHPEDPVSSYAGVAASVTVAEWSDGGSLQGRY